MRTTAIVTHSIDRVYFRAYIVGYNCFTYFFDLVIFVFSYRFPLGFLPICLYYVLNLKRIEDHEVVKECRLFKKERMVNVFSFYSNPQEINLLSHANKN